MTARISDLMPEGWDSSSPEKSKKGSAFRPTDDMAMPQLGFHHTVYRRTKENPVENVEQPIPDRHKTR